MALWTALRGEFLAELLRLEGRGKAAFQTSCHHCLEGTPEFRCTDCFGQDLFCQGCLVSRHEVNPLHRVEVCHSVLMIGLELQTHYHLSLALDWAVLQARVPENFGSPRPARAQLK